MLAIILIALVNYKSHRRHKSKNPVKMTPITCEGKSSNCRNWCQSSHQNLFITWGIWYLPTIISMFLLLFMKSIRPPLINFIFDFIGSCLWSILINGIACQYYTEKGKASFAILMLTISPWCLVLKLIAYDIAGAGCFNNEAKMPHYIKNVLKGDYFSGQSSYDFIEKIRRYPPLIQYGLERTVNSGSKPLTYELPIYEYDSVSTQYHPYASWTDKSEPVIIPSDGTYFFQSLLYYECSSNIQEQISANERILIYETSPEYSTSVHSEIHPKANIICPEVSSQAIISFGKENSLILFMRKFIGSFLYHLSSFLGVKTFFESLICLQIKPYFMSTTKCISDSNEHPVPAGQIDQKARVFQEDRNTNIFEPPNIPKSMTFQPEVYYELKTRFRELDGFSPSDQNETASISNESIIMQDLNVDAKNLS